MTRTTGTGTGPDYVAFVRARQDALLRAAYLICGDHHLAEDLVQEALVKLASRWERLRDEAPEAYVRRILYRDAVSRWRRVRRERLVDHHDPEGVLSTLTAPDATAGWLDGAAVRSALALLPPRQRAVVVLRYFEDLSEQEIAETLGIARGTVKSQASDAIRTLRRLVPALDQEGDEP
ncbi:SigE family RNA polymerase sigma factor [Ornithinimicrobium humiphilum]|jgi:RNA polymerase sigma-70 factor (sigma-E family)|uniref:RNA polymerase sigma-70 factor (Sigma-E family) n=1 Tax=Ornithinimicrobium humiphilum TaxID=125288 RepID=A0A543KK30_9MICO|nr:SigE family RNA polymerase sigma factor [Ornithinimicrobium humiphilum]TQM95406.1 RNA polymerase sigma-70 factor (sigma-E family) [Ornithinimicrobium humiphilum]